MNTLIIDNYDSFTYNLYQYIGELGGNPAVFRNDQISLQQAIDFKPSHIVISPGPGDPRDEAYFGICKQIILNMGQATPLLGVCLGHQGIGFAFGGTIIQAPTIMHGKTSEIVHDNSGVFVDLDDPLIGMRYHSLVVSNEGFPDDLEITATTDDKQIIMGLKHKSYPIHGVQFHPESVGTVVGKQVLSNFLNIKG